jgi:hypothetical protein
MSFLKTYKKNRSITKAIAEAQFDMPKQSQFLGLPQNQVVFQSEIDIAEVVVVEKKYKQTSYKEVFILNLDLVKHLKKGSYRVKRLDVLKTETGELRVVLQTMGYKNSWIESNLETVDAAQHAPVYVVRDKTAEVYEMHEAQGVSPINIMEEDVERSYLNAFEDYEIDSLDHPALEGLLKDDVSIGVVDGFELMELGGDVNELPETLPESGSLEELEGPADASNDSLIELELDEITLDDEDDFDNASLDSLELDDLVA